MAWVEGSLSGGGIGPGGSVDLFKPVDFETWSDAPVPVPDEAEARRPRLGRAEVVEASGGCRRRGGPSRETERRAGTCRPEREERTLAPPGGETFGHLHRLSRLPPGH